MDEYYCPKCGATLNDQSGFDPSKGTWTCTECGEHLMDDDVYNGDTYEGVAWYCDKCGTLLNRQDGFTDSGSSWKCTECGHVNGTTEDDIIDDAFTCPNCGATLNTQWGFDKYADNHECSSCGAKLHHSYSDDEYSVVEDANEFRCPNCDAKLNEQYCFDDYEDDWTCTECGTHLHHDYSSDPYVVCNDDVTEDVSDDESEEEIDDTSAHHYTPSSQPKPVCEKTIEKLPRVTLASKKSLRQKRTKAFLFKFKKLRIGYDCMDLLGENINAVYAALYNRAFSNIKKISVKDIYVDSPYHEGEVEEIVVNGKVYFSKDDMIPYDAEIIITYHEKREITIPFNSRFLKKQNRNVVAEQFNGLGFTEIREVPLKDLTTGWITKNDSVMNVIIDGNDSFRKNTVYKYDAKIEIQYHSFKKNKK